MNTQDEMAGNSVSGLNWCGFDQLELSDDANSVTVTMGSPSKWDKAHLRRLRQSADLPGLVPVIDSDFASNGTPFAVTPVVDAPSLAERIPPSGSEWQDCAAVTEAAARATHEAHLRGLFHGSLSPDQIKIMDDDIAVSGIGLGLGGVPSTDYTHWVAPEVVDGNDPTERSDVYSLGKILEASLGESLEDVPRSVRRLIMWSSSDTPEARPPSALEFASILAEALGEDRKTYSPAFIPTASTNDLASTASEAVASFVPSQASSTSSAAAAGAAGIAGVAGAAAAASLLSDDGPTEVVDTPESDLDSDVAAEADVDSDADADTADPDAADPDPVDSDAGADVAGADEDAEVSTDTIDITDTDLDAEDAAPEAAEMAAATGEISNDDLVAAETAAGDAVFDSRQYGEEINEPDLDAEYVSPAAARTVDLDETFEPERKGNKAGILVGAILAAGLGVVAFQLLSSDDTSDVASDGTAVEDTLSADASDEAGSEEDVASPSTEAPEEETPTTAAEVAPTTAATTATTTATTAAATSSTEASTSSTAQSTTTTEAPAEEATAAAPAATVDGPIAASDAGVQVLHGIPGVEVDVYVDGEALAPGFTLGTIAGPADLVPGSYEVDLYAASDSAPASASDRSDDPLISDTITIGENPTTLVAHLDGDGNPVLSAFEENFENLEPATGRIELRHLAAAPGVVATIDGTEVDGVLEPGKTATVELAAGEHTIETATADGTPVKSATINVADGELAAISVIGVAADDTIDVVVQRYTGLASAPAAIPTGDSDLLGAGEDPTGLYLLGAITSLMAAAGGFVLMRRNRRVL